MINIECFKMPIEYIENKVSLEANIVDDLELLNTKDASATPIYDIVFSPEHVFSKETIKLWAKYYTSDKNFLDDSKKLINVSKDDLALDDQKLDSEKYTTPGGKALAYSYSLRIWLTGRKAVERTVASTSQLLDPRTGDWAWGVIDALNLPRKIFGEIVAPGTVLGSIREDVAVFIGRAGIPVVATACHDTASAVAGIPLSDGENLWLSSGTWSIMGVEADSAVTTPEAFELGFCNELGVDHSVRFLKNIGGLWLIQECKRQWELDGEKFSYSEMAAMAADAESFTAFIDPDDASFASPGEMPAKIRAFCEKTGQAVPADHGQVLRVASESLALKYRVVYDSIRRIQGRDFKRLHTGGGGIQNEMLTRATADALGIEVVAGPVEATSCGNVITQMIGMGHLPDLKSGRDLIRRSFDFKIFEPCDSGVWETAFQRFKKVLEI